jgi:hypothetical protein
MVSPIYILTGKLENYESESAFTGWYSIRRLSAEGPYEAVILSGGPQKYLPEEGPLSHTETDTHSIWCAVLEGRLMIAPKITDSPPPKYTKEMQVRGYYTLDTDSKKMLWHPINNPWDENEIAEYRALSNPSYTLYRKVPTQPAHVFLFGAGASFGSDGKHLYKKGLLPPLGNHLYQKLREDPELKHWEIIPPEIEEVFLTRTFEEGMEALDRDENDVKNAFSRDVELSLFFSKYRPLPSNHYWKLSRKIARRLKNTGWTGAAITLNYERLLEESFMRNEVFTVVKGVTYYDDNLPPLRDDQLFEICYPHGGCQFFIAQSWFDDSKGKGHIVFGETARVEGNIGANHLLKPTNIPIACRDHHIPLICRYHPSKRASVNNYFIDTQKDRTKELIINSEIVTIVGVQCLYQNDEYIWNPLSDTEAFLVYVEPNTEGQSKFRYWATGCGKTEGVDFNIIPKTMKDAFEQILRVNDL